MICSLLNSHSEWTINWKYMFVSISPFLQVVLQLWLAFIHMYEQVTRNTLLVCQSFLIFLKEEKGKVSLFLMEVCMGSSELVRAEGDSTFLWSKDAALAYTPHSCKYPDFYWSGIKPSLYFARLCAYNCKDLGNIL